MISNQGAFEPTKMCAVGSAAHDRVEERPARSTAGVVPVLVTEHEKRVGARRNLQLLQLHPGKRLEG